MYFFIIYTSSLVAYRKSDYTLIVYASFFIWLQYLWSLYKDKFKDYDTITKILTMVTLQKVEQFSFQNSTIESINSKFSISSYIF